MQTSIFDKSQSKEEIRNFNLEADLFDKEE